MKPLRYLVLCPALEWLKHIAVDTDLNRQTIVILPGTRLENNTLDALKKQFGQVKEVRDYKDDKEIERIVKGCYRRFPLEKIIALEEDDILRAAFLRQVLDLKGQSYESALAFRDKIKMKQILARKGVCVPSFKEISKETDLFKFVKAQGYPLILKPSRATGCQGVYILYDKEDIYAAQNIIKGAEASFYQVETFVKGEMYHVDGLVVEGKIACSWPSLYFHPPINMLKGECASSYLLSPENPLVVPLNQYAETILNVMPTPRNTAFHLEFFISQEEKTLIFCEVASRVGGKGINQAWESSFKINLKTLFVSMQYGMDFPCVHMPSSPSFLAGEVWFPCRAGKVKNIPQDCPFPWVRQYEVSVKVGETLGLAQNIDRTLGGSPLLEARTEKEMQEKIHLFTRWFYSTLKMDNPSNP
ncbi:MAG: ATP-grasp domain-containing protein [Caedimonas sp.]|nr:ATP-grasp domain-containing protein [Caedimonas sp.]